MIKAASNNPIITHLHQGDQPTSSDFFRSCANCCSKTFNLDSYAGEWSSLALPSVFFSILFSSTLSMWGVTAPCDCKETSY